MTTPNGHEEPDLGNSSEQATSTVLALDGWGPVVPEAGANGANAANGVEPEAPAAQPEPPVIEEPVAMPRSADWRQTLNRTLPRSAPQLPLDSQLLRVLASAAAMTLALFVAVSLGRRLRAFEAAAPAPAAAPVSVRRRLALAIDPSLTPAPKRRGILAEWSSLLDF